MEKNLRNLLLMCLVLTLALTVVGCSKGEEKKPENETDVVAQDGENVEGGQEEQDHDEEEDHHHDIPYEWSGIFEFAEGTHTIKFNKNEGDESILVAFISADGSIKDMEHHAAHVMDAEAVDVEKDGSFEAENEYTYKLDLKSESAEFKFDVKEPGKYYVFTEHLPQEFDMEILNPEGQALEVENPTEYEGEHDHTH
ncbi:hypothetical protein ACTNDY_03375 [Tissierellaceae bacterium HCP3S3_D8]